MRCCFSSSAALDSWSNATKTRHAFPHEKIRGIGRPRRGQTRRSQGGGGGGYANIGTFVNMHKVSRQEQKAGYLANQCTVVPSQQ